MESNSETAALRNQGFFSHLPEGYSRPEQRTFVVLGLARGGTTMVAKALESFGIFIGNNADNVVGEDTELAEAIESDDAHEVQAIIDRYNSDHDVWGFKRPNVFTRLEGVGATFRNPHYVVVMRDLLSIANRNSLSTFKDPIKDLRESAELTTDLVSFVERNRAAPMFFLSYDRVLADPREFAVAFSDFCGKTLTTKEVRATLHAISPPDDYLEMARTDTFMGRVTAADAASVSGFFRYHQSEETPSLELYVNDEPVDVELTWSEHTIERPNGKTFSGRNAFTLTLVDRELVTGDRVIVVADDRRRQRLRNCPYRVRL